MSKKTFHKSLMKTIIFFYTLNEFLKSSKENQQSKTLSLLSNIYQLPFQCKRQIVENLAFLSNTTNDFVKIMPVCLEEICNRHNCSIKLISNNDDIDEIVFEFKFMTKNLKQAALRDSDLHLTKQSYNQLIMLQ